MGFFNRSDNEDFGEQWRKKYLNLFDEQNKIEHTHREKERLLRQFIIQLSLLNESHDKQLDPILQRVRLHVKNEVDPQSLKVELKTFTDSVKNITPPKKTLNIGLLFEFLLHQYTDSPQQTALRELQKLVSSEANTIEQSSELFLEILKIIEPEKPETAVVLSADESIVEPVVLIDVNAVSEQLLAYFNVLAIPAIFEPETALITEALLNPNQSTKPFNEILSESVQYLVKIKEFCDAEQNDIDPFLLHIATQLSELNTMVSQISTLLEDSAKNRNQLDYAVFTQIRNLQITAIKITSLDALKDNVNQCFKTIASDIKIHHQREKEQHALLQDLTAELFNKMISLELESENLKAELTVTHTQSMLDTLTGLPNRNAYNQRIKDELARYKRYQMPLSLAILDIDYFKSINDTLGYKFGDRVLMLTASVLQEYKRDTDFIARFSGEKFVMVLPNTTQDVALILIDELREIMANTGFNSNGKGVPVTISCGLTDVTEDDTEDSVFERANQALCEAKNTGRNRCCNLTQNEK
ncbi:MAG: GGDEF domain-containing protein [Methylococcaceae bacterium]